MVETALAALADAAITPPAQPPAAATCDDLVAPGVVSTALGADLELEELPGRVQPVIFHAGFLAAGGTHCYWRNGLGSASALTADLGLLPGGAVAWEAYWAGEASDRVTRDAVAGLGDAAYAGCVADIHCFVSVRTGDDWLAVTVNDEASPDERDRAIDLARAVLAAR